MTEPTTNSNYQAIATEVSGFFGYSRDYATMAAIAAQLAHVEAYIVSGYSRFLAAHNWKFLEPWTTLTLSAPYETGTITIVSGVVTGSGTTFPTTSAQWLLTTGGVTYSVATYTNGTSITLDDTSVNVSAGASYSMVRAEYEMPDDFGYLLSPLHYEPADGIGQPIEERGEGVIYGLRSRPTAIETGRPVYYALRPKTTDGTESSHQDFLPWPLSDAEYIVNYKYRIYPDKLVASEYAYGGPAHRETIIEACLSVAESRMEDELGVHEQRYQESLQKSIAFDNRTQPAVLGRMYDSSICRPRFMGNRAQSLTTYNGVAYSG